MVSFNIQSMGQIHEVSNVEDSAANNYKVVRMYVFLRHLAWNVDSALGWTHGEACHCPKYPLDFKNRSLKAVTISTLQFIDI